jgi:UDP-galactopyranose mutase
MNTTHVTFGGRPGSYKYLDMTMEDALKLVEGLFETESRTAVV